jgi:hypothetical protein
LTNGWLVEVPEEEEVSSIGTMEFTIKFAEFRDR